MTGKVINFGDETGKAAGMKLIGNLFLMALTGGIADALSLGKSLGISADDIGGLFEAWNPGSMISARLKRMKEAKFGTPSWELNMARKDAGLMMDAAKQGGTHLMVVPGVAKEMDSWIEKGHGKEDWMVIGKDAVS